MKDPIDGLYKLAIWIRNPAARLASSKAEQFQQVDPETNTDLFNVFEEFDYDYVSSMFLQYKKHVALQENPIVPPAPEEIEDKSDKNKEEGETSDHTEGYSDHLREPLRGVLLGHKEDISNDSESFLVRRIAQANGRRRRRFAYWRKHREKLQQHTAAALQPPSTQNLAQKPDKIMPDARPPLAEAPAQSVTTATRLNGPQAAMNEIVSNFSVSEYSPSAWEPSKDVVSFPPPPAISTTEEFFECPYCFTICSTALLGDKAWK